MISDFSPVQMSADNQIKSVQRKILQHKHNIQNKLDNQCMVPGHFIRVSLGFKIREPEHQIELNKFNQPMSQTHVS